MIKSFYILVSVMGLLCTGMLLHYMTFGRMKETSGLDVIVNVTGLASPSLSVAYYEPRVFLYDEKINPAYPQMQPIDKMDFVYEK